MKITIKDETLRLLYIEQEKDFIAEKIKYHQRSFYLCLVAIAGIPVCYFMNITFVGTGMFFILVLNFLWAILGVFTLLGILPILLNIKKYKEMRQEHGEFLIKYNRSS